MVKYIDAEKLKEELEMRKTVYIGHALSLRGTNLIDGFDEALSIIDSFQQEQPEVDLEKYISNKLRELGADLINHKPYSFNRGLNVGKTNAYRDILDRLNARKED